VWAGVDVGGRRKGFDVAVVDRERLVALERLPSAAAVVGWLEGVRPNVVAVDSPCSPAPPGDKSREGERALARSICGIRYTPDRDGLTDNPTYYEWIEHGLELYSSLEPEFCVIECFPTASWTRWHGRRGSSRRAAWTRLALASLALGGLPKRTNQDVRDAIAAALTARAYDDGQTESFGELVVPRRQGVTLADAAANS
jgi:predicted nuclease with RNAse H fold